MIFQVEAKTRQWIGTVIIGGVIIAMIFTGLIPEKEYHGYVDLVLGAFFYHVIRMLNGPAKQDPTENPTQPPKEG